MSEVQTENVVIVGSGPAGYTAALYTSRADLQPLVIEGFLWGGLLQQTTDVENFPGYPDGVMGPEMMQQLRDQAERFGTRFVTEEATRIELSKDGGLHRVFLGEREIRARAVVLSMGADHRKLGVPGEMELAARGVSYCATCDAAFFRDKQTAIVGGGDSAMEEAIFLSKFASKVTVVHRRAEFRASQIMLDRARATENIELLTPYALESFEPRDGAALTHARLRHTESGEERDLTLDGAFIAVGHLPNSGLVEGQVPLDDDGYAITQGRSTSTGVPGVFAAGDLVDHTYRQAITAAGSGCQAALDAEWYLRDTPPSPEAHWVSEKETGETPAAAAAVS
ncbi:MAG: thioredoxin-disulfide reductase [Thermoleophilaceae bacterium]